MVAEYLQTTNLSVADALKRYEAARRDRVAEIITRARKRSDVTHGKDPAKTQQWYEELRSEDGTSIMNAIANAILGGRLN